MAIERAEELSSGQDPFLNLLFFLPTMRNCFPNIGHKTGSFKYNFTKINEGVLPVDIEYGKNRGMMNWIINPFNLSNSDSESSVMGM